VKNYLCVAYPQYGQLSGIVGSIFRHHNARSRVLKWQIGGFDITGNLLH